MNDRGIPRVSPNYAFTIAYVLLAVAMLAGFFRVETTRNELALEAERRAFVLCESTNENRATLIALIDDLTFVDEVLLDELEPEVRDFLNDVRPERQELLAQARDELASTQCPPDPDDAVGDL